MERPTAATPGSIGGFRPLLVVLLGLASSGVCAFEEPGFSKKTFDTAPLTEGVSHRQDICDRYDAYRNGTVPIRDALKDFALRPIIGKGDFFPYSDEKGIDPANPGIIPVILDELALRAGFTWRESFAVMEFPPPPNVTYTEYLQWGVETYDLAADWWDRTPERLAMGISFLEPWLDGSIILIDKEEPVEKTSHDINLTNFMRPFDIYVWLLILATIVVSGLVYQLIEYIHGERDDRNHWDWTGDNLYLSALNFSGNFEYSPTSFAGRVFAISMAIWALVMTATYTANLASLLVEDKRPPLAIESIEQAVALKIPICTWAGTGSDEHIRKEHPRARRIPISSVTGLEAYQALRNGECELFAAQKDNWILSKGDSRYNPGCDLDWVGRTVQSLSSGFASQADAGHKCTSFVRDVLNVHMIEMINDGVLDVLKEESWAIMQSKHPVTCTADEEEEQGRRRLSGVAKNINEQRTLAAAGASGGAAGAAVSSDVSDSQSLNVEQLLGTFVLHWGLMVLALLISTASTFGNVWSQKKTLPEVGEDWGDESERLCPPDCTSDSPSNMRTSEFDWEARYAELTIQERAMIDFIMKWDAGRLQAPRPTESMHSKPLVDVTAEQPLLKHTQQDHEDDDLSIMSPVATKMSASASRRLDRMLSNVEV